jgi:hypothetical protein
MAGKFKFIVYLHPNAQGQALGSEGWAKIFVKEDELAEKYGVSVLFRGTPYGVSESFVTVYESDKYIDNLSSLIAETGRNQYIAAARTVTVTT